jgi:L-glyceraldehyde 3-phosphate reductase
MGIEYVDIFYHHRPDPETPLEETMSALDWIVRSGRALYAGVSRYDPTLMVRAQRILKQLGTPCIIHQPSYNMFNRAIEGGLLDHLQTEGIGCIAFSPLAQGMLTDRYLGGIPEDSRAAKPHGYLKREQVSEEKLVKVRKLNELAQARGQTIAQMAVSWVLRHQAMTSAVIGASRISHIEEAAAAAGNSKFADEELKAIDGILNG